MKKKIFKVYSLVLVLVTIFITYTALYDVKNNTRKFPAENSVINWTSFETIESEDGVSFVGDITIDPSVGDVLAFFTIHQTVKIFCNGELVYQYPIVQNNPLWVSPGYSWNIITLPQKNNYIRIDISSPYPQYSHRAPSFLLGNILSISSRIVNNNLLSCVICIIIFFLGAGMVAYWFCIRKTVKIQSNLFHLGVFAMLLSIWSINETTLVTLIMHNNIANTYLAFTTLMLLPLPFSYFVRTFYNEDSILWSIFSILNLTQIITCIALHMLKIKDFRQTLWTTHIIFAILAIFLLFSSVKILLKGVKSKRVAVHLLCISICAIGLASDLLTYYRGSWDSNAIGRLSFLFYFLVLGYSSTRESSELIKRGKKAAIYRQLAYTDQMTDTLNRTAFSHDFEEHLSKPDNSAIIVFDLNNLKQANDNYGHSAGDKYITSSADIIKDSFEKYGKCYRTGGDEFATIISDSRKCNIDKVLKQFEQNIDDYNISNDGFPLNIAIGYAVFDSSLDNTFEETYKRADKKMYENKKIKKGA